MPIFPSGLRRSSIRCCEGNSRKPRRVVTGYFHSLLVIYGTVSRRGVAGAPPAPVRPGRQGPVSECDRRPLTGQRHAIEIRTPQPCRSQHFPGNTDTRVLDSTDSPTWLFFSECPGRRRRVGFHCWRRVDRAKDHSLKADSLSLGF